MVGVTALSSATSRSRCSSCATELLEPGRSTDRATQLALGLIDLRGSAFGLLAAVQAFGNLAASAVAAVIWTVFSPAWAFAYLAGWMVFAFVVVLTSSPKTGGT